MKIAIMTHPLGKNYGGIMQAFSLQKVLKTMGHDVVTIDYNKKERNVTYRMSRFFFRVINKLVFKRQAFIMLEKHHPYIFKETLNFIDLYINRSDYIDSEKKLKKHFKTNDYDAVIVGSDQTWRPKYVPNIFNYYLDFLQENKDIKKIAYASSFGVDTWEYTKAETEKCSRLAKIFDAVSVREASGVNLCEKYLGISSEYTLDPTLLLSLENYYEVIGDRLNPVAEGLFTYILDDDKEIRDSIKVLAREIDMKPYQCQPKLKVNTPTSKNLDDYKMPAVQDWLASFANAEFIVTDSFHGTVFSIIFNKPFLVIKNKKRGASRFESLLGSLEMLDRMVDTPHDIRNAYKKANLLSIPSHNDKLLKIKKSSLNFLYDIKS